jgi:heme oxygenase (biliverdin-producing, ferredoxin)
LSRRLAERLRTETRALHAAAERTALMSALMRGTLDRATYCALLRNLHAIYAALEPALQRHAQHPALAALRLPGLARSAALEHDLHVLHGPHWASELAVCPAASAYAARVRGLDAAQPALLAAHAYVRYLGDLSGGQQLRGVVARITSPAGASATAFYEFGDAAQARALTQAFRDGLAEVSRHAAHDAALDIAHDTAQDTAQDAALGAAHEDALVAEAAWAYEAHRQLFEALMTSGVPPRAAAASGTPTAAADPAPAAAPAPAPAPATTAQLGSISPS